MMPSLGKLLERLGQIMIALGAMSFAAIFIIVMINGKWPVFLQPIRLRFQMASEWAGSFAFIIEIFFFIGPGLAISWLGEKLKKSK